MTPRPTAAQLDKLDLDWYEADIARIDAERRYYELENVKLEWETRLISERPIKHGEFVYAGEVEEEHVHALIEQMTTWSNLHPEQPITLYINSGGGYVTDGFALYDYLLSLRAKGHHVTTVGLGIVASMAGVLLQAGDERVITPRTWLMIHQVEFGAGGKLSTMKNLVRFNERLQEQALDVLAERSSVSKRTIKQKWTEDWWLDAGDALKGGFVDKILAV